MSLSKKIALISPPFLSHYSVLLKLGQRLMELEGASVTLIMTGWENMRLSEKERRAIQATKISLVELQASALKIPAPCSFTFPRALELVDPLIKLCQDKDLLIYDYFSVEAYIAGEVLGIPSLCAIRVLGPFNPQDSHFLNALAENEPHIRALEARYNLDFFHHIEYMGDAFFISSGSPILQLSWPGLVEIDDYQKNRNLHSTIFIRPDYSGKKVCKKRPKKTIYFALGSILTQYLWQDPLVQKKAKHIAQVLLEALEDHPNYEVIVATGRKITDLFERIPNNFQVYETVNQVDILEKTDVFITHVGANSANEAIDANVPMLAIPFCGDQYQIARNISRLKIGLAVMEESSTSSGVISFDTLLEPGKLLNIIADLAHNPDFHIALHDLKAPYEHKSTYLTGLQSILKWCR
jgi:hypothetical protein